jgi:hypothetical protein
MARNLGFYLGSCLVGMKSMRILRDNYHTEDFFETYVLIA